MKQCGMFNLLRKVVYRPLVKYISDLSPYYERVGFLIENLPTSQAFRFLLGKKLGRDILDFSSGHDDVKQPSSLFIVNGVFNHSVSIQESLEKWRELMSRDSRLCVVVYNSYFSGFFQWAHQLSGSAASPPSTFITMADFLDLADISGYDIVKSSSLGFGVSWIPWIGDALEKFWGTLPIAKYFGLFSVFLFRPRSIQKRSVAVSVIVPARNEAGTIEAVIARCPTLGSRTEIVFVEGHSSDDTWNKILDVQKQYRGPFVITAFQQSGKGKANAVREGIAKANGELIVILDSDLAVAPEALPVFVKAYEDGRADFINGSRLTYPMEGSAMRFLNRFANIFFAKFLSWILEIRLTDSLCGTKAFSKSDYLRFAKWRERFGDFDPFGDFELLFPASFIGLRLINIPIHYKARVYGETNIQRFRDGWRLFCMCMHGLFRLKWG